MGLVKLALPLVASTVCFIAFCSLMIVEQFNTIFCISDEKQKSSRYKEKEFKHYDNDNHHDVDVENETTALIEVNTSFLLFTSQQEFVPWMLPPVAFQTTVEIIAQEFSRTRMCSKSVIANETTSCHRILTCGEMNSMNLRPSRMKVLNLPTKLHQSRSTWNASVELQAEKAKKAIFNLLKMHTWYGVQKLRGLCMLSPMRTDVIQYILGESKENRRKLSNTGLRNISYMVSQAAGSPLCDINSSKNDCKRLVSVSSKVRAASKPGLASLTLMFNTARLFEQLWTNGATLNHFSPDSILVGENFEVSVSNFNMIKFLTANSNTGGTKYQRMLSGTICKHSEDCPALFRDERLFVFEYAPDCAEVNGLCWKENECWGIDAHTHACLLSRWMFSRLRSLVPAFWSHEGELTKLLRCGYKQLPSERCNWTTLKEGFQSLLQMAVEDWT